MGRRARFWEVLGLRLKAPGDRSPTCNESVHRVRGAFRRVCGHRGPPAPASQPAVL